MSVDEIRFGTSSGMSVDGDPITPSVTVHVHTEDLTKPHIDWQVTTMAQFALDQARRCDLTERP